MAKMSEFKRLASLAKQRLREGNYSDKKNLKNNYTSSYYYKNMASLKKLNAELNFVLINNNENELFNKKVFELLEVDEDNFTPIKQLCDYSIYSKLNDQEKQNYILRLSERYIKAKELYFQTLNKNIG